MLESKARGRHQSQAASLRISKIEKILSSRTDLTKQQRRKLQSRKNTANFRERQKNTIKLKHFINYELDAILNSVSIQKTKILSLAQRCVRESFNKKCLLAVVTVQAYRQNVLERHHRLFSVLSVGSASCLFHEQCDRLSVYNNLLAFKPCLTLHVSLFL